MAALLLVEDDPSIAESLSLAMVGLGHTVHSEGSAESALAALPATPVDLAIVDVMLPGIDGFELCRRLRATSDTPVLLLTARGDAIDIVAGLECGADDYVVKPVEPRVLDARVKTILRRAAPLDVASSGELSAGTVTVNEASMIVTRDGVPLALTPTELRLLIELLRHRGQVLSRRTLLERVWDYGFVGDARLVDSAVQRLRAKIETDPANPMVIITVRGIGYRIDG